MLDILDMKLTQLLFNRQLLRDVGLDIDNLTEKEQNDLCVKMVTHITEECHEVLRELNWKIHKPNTFKPLNKDKILEELVDITKFLVNFLVYLDIQVEDFETTWKTKSKLVEQKYSIERSKSL